MSARDTILVSMPGADMATLSAERCRLLGEVHPGTAVVVTRGMAPEPELRALCVRAETLLSAAAAADMTGAALHPGAWHKELSAWQSRYRQYLEAEAAQS
jgi:hypothetical protein